MLQDQYDVIVVGAGPAGSVTARYAAEGGASVLMLERDREPGIPVRCAEGVSHNGIAPFIDIDQRWIASTINIAKLQSPNGNSALMYNNGTGYVLQRRIFDTALCELACRKGATLITKADVTGLIFSDSKINGVRCLYRGRNREIKARIVIGADGVESRVGRWAGINTAVSLKDIDTCIQYTMANVDLQADTCEFYFGTDVAPGGYIWIFPKSADTANVGIGIAGHLAAEKGPAFYLDRFIKQRFQTGSITNTVYGSVPTAATLKEIVKDNLMLVGDAARQVNPITGGGVVHAMIAGRIAGRVAAEAVRKNEFSSSFLSAYQKEWDKSLGKNQKIMYAMKEKFLRMTDDKFNRIVDYCKKIPQDEFSLKALFTEAVKGDPKLVLDVAKAFVISKFK